MARFRGLPVRHGVKAIPPTRARPRINNNGNYEPGNVRWATPVEQNNNTSANRLLTIGGRAATIAEHARAASIPYKVLHKRVNDGWSPEILAALLRIYRERAGGGQMALRNATGGDMKYRKGASDLAWRHGAAVIGLTIIGTYCESCYVQDDSIYRTLP